MSLENVMMYDSNDPPSLFIIPDIKDKLEADVIQMNLDTTEKLRKKNLLSLARRQLQLKNQKDTVVNLNNHGNKDDTDLIVNNFVNQNSCSDCGNSIVVNNCVNEICCLHDIEAEKQKSKLNQKDILLLARKELQTKNNRKIVGFKEKQFEACTEIKNQV